MREREAIVRVIPQSALEREEGDCMISAGCLEARRRIFEGWLKGALLSRLTEQGMSFKSENNLLAEVEHYL